MPLERRHPFVTAAWATGGVLTVLLAAGLATKGWEVILARREAAIREQAVQHWPGAVSLCGEMLESQAMRDFGLTSNEDPKEAAKRIAQEATIYGDAAATYSNITDAMTKLALQIEAIRRWDALPADAFQFQDVEVLGDPGPLRFSGVGTGFDVAHSPGYRPAVRERTYVFSFVYDVAEPRCLDTVIVAD